jgi:hypothetical protein
MLNVPTGLLGVRIANLNGASKAKTIEIAFSGRRNCPHILLEVGRCQGYDGFWIDIKARQRCGPTFVLEIA